MTREELAEIVGVSIRQLQRINKELPDEKKLFKENEINISGKDAIRKWIDYKTSFQNQAWTKNKLAKLTGYSAHRVFEIEKENDVTFFVESPDGGYDIEQFVRRWVQLQIDKTRENSADFDAVRAEHEKIKTLKTRIEVQKLEGQLIDVDLVRSYWMNTTSNFRQQVMQFGDHVAPLLTGLKDQQEVKRVIDNEGIRMLETLSESAIPPDEESEDD